MNGNRKNCLSPDELADEALARVAQLEEKGQITVSRPPTTVRSRQNLFQSLTKVGHNT
jgi:hypothetical protein